MPHPYLVDSNFFLQAWKMHYPNDVIPGFWIKVSELANAGKIISIDKVKDELYTNPDSLTNWMDNHLPGSFFKDTSTVITAYGRICAWATSRSSHYTSGALAKFLEADEADAWLVAYGVEMGISIVTHEISDPNRRSSIKIPDACHPFGVSCLKTIDMFRKLGETF